MSRISDLAGFTTALSTTQDLSVGVITATSFSGDGSGLTGVASTDNIQTATDAKFLANVSIAGTLTYLDVTNVDSIGVITGRNGLDITGVGTFSSDIKLGPNAQLQTGGTDNLAITAPGSGHVTLNNYSIFYPAGNVILNNGGQGTTQIKNQVYVLSGITSFMNDVSVENDTELGRNLSVTGIGTFEDRLTYDGSLGQAGGGTVTYTVTVASKDSTHRYNGQGSGNAYIIDNLQAPVLTLTPGRTYRFTNDNTGSHPLKFYYDANKTTLYTTGVTFDNSYTEITVTDTTPAVLHYQCTSHSLMGNSVITQSNPIVGAGITLNGNGGGVHVTGVVTATSFSGDGSSLTGVGPQFTGIASGSIADGKPVVITTDGKVMAVTGESATDSAGSKVVFETSSTDSTNGHGNVYDPDENKVIIAYCNQGDSDKLEYAIGTVGAGQTITFTSSVHIGNDGVNPRLAYDTNSNRLVVAYRDPGNSNYGTARVGTVASGGGSISWGSAVLYEGQYSAHNEIIFDSTNNKIVIAYRNQGESNRGTAIVGTVSGSSISFGSGAVFETGATSNFKMAFDEISGKILIMYVDDDDGNYCKAVVATVSGTSISFGSKTTFNANSSEYPTCVYFPPAQKIFCAVRNNTSNIIAKLATISGTSVTFGSQETVTSNNNTNYLNQAVYHTAADRIYLSYRYGSDTYYRNVKYTTTQPSGIDFDAAEADTGYGQYYPSFASYDPDTKQIVYSFVDPDNSSAGTAIVNTVEYSNTNLTSSNFIGISNAAYSNGDTATVQVPGAVDDAQTGLTTGAKIYVDPTGILSTSAGTPSVVAGRAVAATKLLISFA